MIEMIAAGTAVVSGLTMLWARETLHSAEAAMEELETEYDRLQEARDFWRSYCVQLMHHQAPAITEGPAQPLPAELAPVALPETLEPKLAAVASHPAARHRPRNEVTDRRPVPSARPRPPRRRQPSVDGFAGAPRLVAG